MPQPDIVLTREPRGKGPDPARSVALLVEVSSTTLEQDTTTKLALYASAGVPEYWIVDVASERITQLWSPANSSYEQRREVAFGTTLVAATGNRIAIETEGLA